MRSHLRRMNTRSFMLTLLVLGLPGATAWAFVGGFSGVVFDPTNFVENVRQVQALLQQVEHASTQIELQRRVLAALPVTVSEGLSTSAPAIQRGLREGLTLPDATMGSLYPLDLPEPTPAWLDDVRSRWLEAERASLELRRAAAEQVHEQMADVSAQTRTLIDASNGAGLPTHERPGPRAVLQAQEELLAVCSHELDKLLALRGLQAHHRTMTRSRAQAEAAYRGTRQKALTRDWNSAAAPSPRPVNSTLLP